MKLLCRPSGHHCRKIQSRFSQSLVTSSASRARCEFIESVSKGRPLGHGIDLQPLSLKNSTKMVGKLRTLIRQTLLQIELAIFNLNLDSLTLHFNRFYLIQKT